MLAHRRYTPVVLVALLMPVWSWATVQEQRTRLPDPAEGCGDTLDGTWLAHVYYPHVREWYLFTLRLETEGPTVTGVLQSHFWEGEPDAPDVPSCSADTRYPLSVVEPVTGTWVGGQLVVNATAWNNGGPSCTVVSPGGYLLDNFSGPVDLNTQEWVSVLDADSPLWTAVPTLFRRIACEEDGPSPVSVEPPPFSPPSAGCGWW